MTRDLPTGEESISEKPTSPLADFGRAIAYSGIVEPLNGVAQLGGKLAGVEVEHWNLMRPENPNGWGAKFGSAVGVALDFWTIGRLTRGKGSALSLNAAELSVAPSTTAAIGRSAITGALYNGIAIPVDSNRNLTDFVQDRLSNAIVGATTFAALTGSSKVLPLVPGLSSVAQGNTWLSRILLGGLSGIPAGIVNAETQSLVYNHQLTGDVAGSIRDFSVIGGVLGALPHASGRVKRDAVEGSSTKSLTPSTESLTPTSLMIQGLKSRGFASSNAEMVASARGAVEQSGEKSSISAPSTAEPRTVELELNKRGKKTYDGEKMTNEDHLVLLSGLETLPKRGGGLFAVGPYQGLDMAVTLGADSLVLGDLNPVVVRNNRAALETIRDSARVEDVLPNLFKRLELEDPDHVRGLKKMLEGTHHFGSRYKFGWATNEADFSYIKNLINNGKAVVAHIDIADPKSTSIVGKFFENNNSKMEYAYLSNANDPNNIGGRQPNAESQRSHVSIRRALESAGGHDKTVLIRSDSATDPNLLQVWARWQRTPEEFVETTNDSKENRMVRYGANTQVLPERVPRVSESFYVWEFFVQTLKDYRDHLASAFPNVR